MKKKIYIMAFFLVLIVGTIVLYNNFLKPESKEVFDGTLVKDITVEYKG